MDPRRRRTGRVIASAPHVFTREPLLTAVVVVLAAMWLRAVTQVGGPGTADFFGRWVYDAIFLLAAATCLTRAFGRRGGGLPWALVGLGLFASVVGNLIYSLAPDLAAVPVPSVSDPMWLAIYPCLVIAVFALVRRRVGPTSPAPRLDGVLSGLAIAAVLATVTLPAALDSARGTPFWGQVTTLAYPVGDLIALGAIVSAIALARWRLDRVWILLGAAILVWVSGDVIYALGADGQSGDLADALIATGVVGMAAAARAARPAALERGRRDEGVSYLPVLFGLIALGVLIASMIWTVVPAAQALAAAALAVVLLRTTLALHEIRILLRASRVEALTDSLTGLGNRRRLTNDLELALRDGAASAAQLLVLLDLNGFKAYNDSYGHGAGDALLAQLGRALAETVAGIGDAYRMGGDEFCVLARLPADPEAFASRCGDALATHGDGFSITAALGAVTIPGDSDHAAGALAFADALMYRNKTGRRMPAAHQSVGVLTALVQERAPRLATHAQAVGELASALAQRLGVTDGELATIRHAAALHDIGKLAIPESILAGHGRLSPGEWDLVHSHPVVGERILTAAPALLCSARLVRSSHERIDGRGYPDGLAGAAIPLGSRIIHVADAFAALTAERAHRDERSVAHALDEIERASGTQFDPRVVAALRAVATEHPAPELLAGYPSSP